MTIQTGRPLGFVIAGAGVASQAMAFGDAASSAELGAMVADAYVNAPAIEETPTAPQAPAVFSPDIAARVARMKGSRDNGDLSDQQLEELIRRGFDRKAAEIASYVPTPEERAELQGLLGVDAEQMDLLPVIQKLKETRGSPYLEEYSKAQLDDLKSTVLRELERVMARGIHLYGERENALIKDMRDDNQRIVSIQCLKENMMGLQQLREQTRKLGAVDIEAPEFWTTLANNYAELCRNTEGILEGEHRPTLLLAHLLYYGQRVVTRDGTVKEAFAL
jgi:hypothetical protein